MPTAPPPHNHTLAVVAGSDTENVTVSQPGAFAATIPPAALPAGSTMGFEMRNTKDAVDADRLLLAAIITGHTQTAAQALRLLPSAQPSKDISVGLNTPKVGGGSPASGKPGECPDRQEWAFRRAACRARKGRGALARRDTERRRESQQPC